MLIHVLTTGCVCIQLAISCQGPKVLYSFGLLYLLKVSEFVLEQIQVSAKEKVLEYFTLKNRVHYQGIKETLEVEFLFLNHIGFSLGQAGVSLKMRNLSSWEHFLQQISQLLEIFHSPFNLHIERESRHSI